MKAKIQMFFVWFLTGLFLLPVVWMFGTAFKPAEEIVQADTALLPSSWTLSAFASLWQGEMFTLLSNTIFISISATLFSVAVAFLAAYALVRYRFPAKFDHVFLLLVLIIKMMPPIVIAIPLYSLMNQADLLNSKIGLILAYQVYTLPFCIWMLLGFIRDIPIDIEEAGMMDGAKLIPRLYHIVFPLCAPGLVATSIFAMILGWNEFLFSLLFMHTPEQFTIPLFIANFITEDGTEWGQLMAIGLLSSLPMLALAGYMQRYLLRGFSMGLK
ncbi:MULTISPECIES: carbohydrate ABC transporter permease [unclassified Vibrio]|uniref:Carbohydrate ABC transporter permease n=1 Tax=Vibrio sp. HB236076 TaxID=3232307 RepID=A0AB39HHK5_9VIBR|nr:carbohydrate ABC transporter permease [Vibrio sp. HB161653]MDP5254996.1 carbohydrate ABC transporter permease [Vibrio sp. HB161653]